MSEHSEKYKSKRKHHSSSDSESDSSGSESSDSEREREECRHHKKSKHRDDDKSDKKKSKESKDEKKAAKKAKKAENKLKKKMLKEAKKLLKKGKDGDSNTISEEDYFAKNAELRVWLLDKGIYFDDLDGDEQRTWFKKFVIAWNAKDLDSKFYKGIDHSQLSSTQRTSFKWGFTKKLNEHEAFELESARDSVDSQTFHQKYESAFSQPSSSSASSSSSSSSSSRASIGPSLPSRR